MHEESVSFSNHWQEACFNLYKELFNHQTAKESETMYLGGRDIYTFTWRSPQIKALFTLSWETYQSFAAAMLMRQQSVVNLAIEAIRDSPSILLCVPLGNESQYVSFRTAIRIVLHLIHSFGINMSFDRWKGCQSPCLILFKCL